MTTQSGTFAPSPGAAPLGSMVLAQARMEARLMLRNGEQVLLAVVIPLIVLAGGLAGIDRLGLEFRHRPIDVLTPGVLALAVMSTAFTSLAIATGFERRYGVIKRLGSSPLPRHGLLLGKVSALLLIEALQVVVISSVALALGWQPHLDPMALVLSLTLATAAFASLGLMAGGAVVVPAEQYGALGTVAQWLPSGALGEAMRAALIESALDVRALLVLLAWTIVGGLLAGRYFTWE